jgi:hypothetical protein
MSLDFRTGPTDDNGNPVQAPTFENTGGLHPQWVGHLYTATAGALSFFDELVTVEKQLRGGWYELMDDNAVMNDYIEESVIYKDDVLGLFETYGLTVGEPGHILELKKYVKKEYVNPNNTHARQVFQAASTFTITAGLYLRTSYNSTGGADVAFKMVTLAYQ